MPKELKTAEQFEKILPNAVELRVVRERDFVKLKLRTSDFLYTFKTNEDDAEEYIKNAKELEVVEYGKPKEKSDNEEEDKTKETKKKKK